MKNKKPELQSVNEDTFSERFLTLCIHLCSLLKIRCFFQVLV